MSGLHRNVLVSLVALVLMLACAPAGARNECVLDRCMEAAQTRPFEPRRSGVAPGDFDFYVLALSWSAGFCALSDKDREQCAPGSGKGFVVHGLWPQGERASPADCEAGLRPPARADVQAVRDLFPSEGLARYEWRKHGGCSGLPASAYFADVRRARAEIEIPPEFSAQRSSRRLAPEDILRSFRAANPRLRPGMAAVACPRNTFQEVRFCMSKDLRDFVPCPDIVSRSCRARDIDVPPPL